MCVAPKFENHVTKKTIYYYEKTFFISSFILYGK